MPTSRIIDLRRILAERFPHESLPQRNDQLSTGLTNFDTALHGGLTKGAITELTSDRTSAGSASLVAALLQRASKERFFVALIDGRDSFDPASVSRRALCHMLWVRCSSGRESMQAADLLLRDGNFPLVILDLMLNSLAELRKIPSSNWYRLQRLVEPASIAFLVLTPRSMISSAQWKLSLENRWNLPQLDWAKGDLQGQLNFRLQRAQRHQRNTEEEMAC